MSSWLGNLYGVAIVILMLLFIGIWIWAWSRGNNKKFDRAARMPMEDAENEKPTPPSDEEDRR
jgi:cytochrome c oxidase cbb3-type subunit 4